MKVKSLEFCVRCLRIYLKMLHLSCARGWSDAGLESWGLNVVPLTGRKNRPVAGTLTRGDKRRRA